ncbi:MAG TPA: selenocysteine-specific translation elongation factor [Bryobacteraceae bacterium]
MSDSNMIRRGGIVIGTAGHIDHGKTSLIGALTGVDTDRLAEEKRRGISIDLGFAHLDLAGGRRVSFVDVPGHERFIRNMLAGAAGIEAVLLIIAADESVKPQTREHFEICRLLGIERGLVVLTKCDLASPAQILAAEAATRQMTTGSFLENARILPVSAVTGAGLDALRDALASLGAQPSARDVSGFARLPLDRSFSLKGFGTIVTGTLTSGRLQVGDTVQIQPIGHTARIRGLQVHGAPVPTAFAGERTAVNLSGIDHSDLRRGFTLLSPAGLEPTKLIQASLMRLDAEDFDAREDMLLHIGTAEVAARLRPLSSGDPLFVQLNLREPVLALPGDRFILRRPSPPQTIAGGSVIDVFPPRLSRAKAAARLAQLQRSELGKRLSRIVDERENGRTLPDLVRLTGRTQSEIRAAVTSAPQLLLVETAQRVVTRAWIARARDRVLSLLEKFHAAQPSAPGAPLAHVRLGLETQLAQFVLTGFSAVRIEGDTVALATHRARTSPQEAAALAQIEQKFRQAGYQPPSPAQIPRGPLEQLIKKGKLVRISNDLVFHADVIAHICNSLSSHKGRRFSVPEFKDWIQISRKYAIPLLEFLDHQRVTKREGDLRVIL